MPEVSDCSVPSILDKELLRESPRALQPWPPRFGDCLLQKQRTSAPTIRLMILLEQKALNGLKLAR